MFSLLFTGDELLVSEEVWPAIEMLAFLTDRFVVFLRWTLPSRLGQLLVTWKAIFRKRFIERPTRVLVNVGAGVWYVPEWRILDHYGSWYRMPRALIDFEHDLTKPVPLPHASGSVDLFYCEHVMEHLPDDACRWAFAEMFRSLKRGGGARIVVPDASLLYDRLLASDHEFYRRLVPDRTYSIEEQFLVQVAHPRHPVDPAEFERALRKMPREAFLNWCKRLLVYDYERAGEHINWFNFAKLSEMLAAAGFTVRLSSAQQSAFPEIRGSAFDTRAWYSLHVDATKT